MADALIFFAENMRIVFCSAKATHILQQTKKKKKKKKKKMYLKISYLQEFVINKLVKLTML